MTDRSSAAAEYGTIPWHVRVFQVVTEFLLSNLSWLGVDFNDPASEFEPSSKTSTKQVRFLDYACGPGTLTKIFLPYITEAIGIDVSEGMVEEYTKRFATEESSATNRATAKAFVGNLVSATDLTLPSEPHLQLFQSFDFVAVGFAFHHFEDLPTTTKTLANCLKPGGIFMILDLVDERGQPHDHHHQQPIDTLDNTSSEILHIVTHTHGVTQPHGFTRNQVEEYFTQAGLVDFKMKLIDQRVQVVPDQKDEDGNVVKIEKQLFVAVGRRPLK